MRDLLELFVVSQEGQLLLHQRAAHWQPQGLMTSPRRFASYLAGRRMIESSYFGHTAHSEKIGHWLLTFAVGEQLSVALISEEWADERATSDRARRLLTTLEQPAYLARLLHSTANPQERAALLEEINPFRLAAVNLAVEVRMSLQEVVSRFARQHPWLDGGLLGFNGQTPIALSGRRLEGWSEWQHAMNQLSLTMQEHCQTVIATSAQYIYYLRLFACPKDNRWLGFWSANRSLLPPGSELAASLALLPDPIASQPAASEPQAEPLEKVRLRVAAELGIAADERSFVFLNRLVAAAAARRSSLLPTDAPAPAESSTPLVVSVLSSNLALVPPAEDEEEVYRPRGKPKRVATRNLGELSGSIRAAINGLAAAPDMPSSRLKVVAATQPTSLLPGLAEHYEAPAVEFVRNTLERELLPSLYAIIEQA